MSYEIIIVKRAPAWPRKIPPMPPMQVMYTHTHHIKVFNVTTRKFTDKLNIISMESESGLSNFNVCLASSRNQLAAIKQTLVIYDSREKCT